ncbi:hypothetical protein P8452_71950 [Trifolium repens]|nr:hypothetical protein P8452_71950 [Trifolium repens]
MRKCRAYQLQTKVYKLQLTITMVHVKNEEERRSSAPHPYLSLHREERFTLPIQNPNFFYFRKTRPHMHHLDVKMILAFACFQ